MAATAGNTEVESATSLKATVTSQSQEIWSDEDDELLATCYDDDFLPKDDSSKTKQIEFLSLLPDAGHHATPFQLYRPAGYMCVSDFTKQHWCEQMMLYSYTLPTVYVEDPVMTAGSSLHLARELEVHSVVQVKTSSKEDNWGVKIINLLTTALGFLQGVTVAREIPIFGAPFGKDMFIVGIIDELRFDPDTYTISLSELKTRSMRSPPRISQQNQNRLQVMMYKKLFDDIVKGLVSKETVARHLKLDLMKPFSEDVVSHLDQKFVTAKNLDELLDVTFLRIQSLTCISELQVEYVHQQTKESLLKTTPEYDEEELHSLFDHLLKFWHGQRETEGVDIEDAWKCQRCEFADVCEWREKKATELSAKNSQMTKINKAK